MVERHPRDFARETRNAHEDQELRKRFAPKAEFASTTIRQQQKPEPQLRPTILESCVAASQLAYEIG